MMKAVIAAVAIFAVICPALSYPVTMGSVIEPKANVRKREQPRKPEIAEESEEDNYPPWYDTIGYFRSNIYEFVDDNERELLRKNGFLTRYQQEEYQSPHVAPIKLPEQRISIEQINELFKKNRALLLKNETKTRFHDQKTEYSLQDVSFATGRWEFKGLNTGVTQNALRIIESYPKDGNFSKNQLRLGIFKTTDYFTRQSVSTVDSVVPIYGKYDGKRVQVLVKQKFDIVATTQLIVKGEPEEKLKDKQGMDYIGPIFFGFIFAAFFIWKAIEKILKHCCGITLCDAEPIMQKGLQFPD